MSKYREDPPPLELIEQLYYKDGSLFWKDEYCIKQKKRSLNKPIGNLDKWGYLVFTSKVGQTDNKIRNYKVHRVIYYLEKGVWPPVVDHKDRNKVNNQIDNLLPSDLVKNAQNKTKRCDSDGYQGVRMDQSGKYRAFININGKFYSVGNIHDAKHAALIRDLMAVYNNGEHANTNFLGKTKIKIGGVAV
ncbi:hypothetical protein G4E03_003470 [Salmonella enterica]|nr:hypothetical protein [Salmonella enterica]